LAGPGLPACAPDAQGSVAHLCPHHKVFKDRELRYARDTDAQTRALHTCVGPAQKRSPEHNSGPEEGALLLMVRRLCREAAEARLQTSGRLPGLPPAALTQTPSPQPRSGTSSAFRARKGPSACPTTDQPGGAAFPQVVVRMLRWSRCTTCCFGRSCAFFYGHCTPPPGDRKGAGSPR
jgi:hypothetical protein